MIAKAMVAGMAVVAITSAATPAFAAATWTTNGLGKTSAKAGTLAATTGFVANCTSPGVANSETDLSWTASTTTQVTGYQIVRTAPSLTTQTYNISGRTTTTYHDSNQLSSTNKVYTYSIRAVYAGTNWQSSAQTDTVSTQGAGKCQNS